MRHARKVVKVGVVVLAGVVGVAVVGIALPSLFPSTRIGRVQPAPSMQFLRQLGVMTENYCTATGAFPSRDTWREDLVAFTDIPADDPLRVAIEGDTVFYLPPEDIAADVIDPNRLRFFVHPDFLEDHVVVAFADGSARYIAKEEFWARLETMGYGVDLSKPPHTGVEFNREDAGRMFKR